jgi:hypothetical protein
MKTHERTLVDKIENQAGDPSQNVAVPEPCKSG